MSINKRIFGTPLKGIVRDKLEARQGVTDNLEPGQSLEGSKIAVSNYDYASKLPFVRMWTSVKIISPADLIEDAEEILVSELENPDVVPLYKLRQNVADKYGTTVDQTSVKEIKNPDTGKVEKYIINATTRDQLNFNRKIYEIGNHNYLTSYGEAKPNEITFNGKTQNDEDFPNESQKELNKVLGSVRKEGFSIVPINIYFNNKGLVKLNIGLGKGKKKFDKRESQKMKDWNKAKQRLLKNS